MRQHTLALIIDIVPHARLPFPYSPKLLYCELGALIDLVTLSCLVRYYFILPVAQHLICLCVKVCLTCLVAGGLFVGVSAVGGGLGAKIAADGLEVV